MLRPKPILLSCLTLIACLAAAAPALAANQVYWANETGNTISYANLDGSGGGGQLTTTGAVLSTPYGAAIDPATNKIYWANSGNSTISYANLDGSGGGQLNTAPVTPNGPAGVAIDPATNKIYWANQNANTISYANLDGSGGGGDLNIAGATPSGPAGVAIDPATNKIYWANENGNSISYANLDNTGGGGQLNASGATISAPIGVAIDLSANKIYTANGNSISYVNLDGSGGGQLNTTGATLSNPIGVAVDSAANKVYWGNEANNTISYANLDNTGGGGHLSTTGATPNGVTFPILLELPSPAGAPAISGGSTTGSTLTCSTGTWAGDLLGAFLFRAPQSYAYSWTLNGSTITGANTNTITASSPGNYACQVSASNHAGSASQASGAHTVSTPPPPPPPPAPTTTTGSATNVKPRSATLNGTVNPNGLATTYYFQYGTSTGYGSQTGSQSAGSGSTPQSETAALSGLLSGKTYHFRIVARNNTGTSYGTDATFTTPRLPLKLAISARSARAGQRACFRFTATTSGYAVAGVRVRFAGHSRKTSKTGRVIFCAKLSHGTYRAIASKAGYRAATARLTVTAPPRPKPAPTPLFTG